MGICQFMYNIKTCLSLLPTSFKVKPLFKPKIGLNVFVDTGKTKTKVLDNFLKTLSLSPV